MLLPPLTSTKVVLSHFHRAVTLPVSEQKKYYLCRRRRRYIISGRRSERLSLYTLTNSYFISTISTEKASIVVSGLSAENGVAESSCVRRRWLICDAESKGTEKVFQFGIHDNQFQSSSMYNSVVPSVFWVKNWKKKNIYIYIYIYIFMYIYTSVHVSGCKPQLLVISSKDLCLQTE